MHRHYVALVAALLLTCCDLALSSSCNETIWLEAVATSCTLQQIEAARSLVLNTSSCGEAFESKVLRVYTPYPFLFPVLEAARQQFESQYGCSISISSPDDFYDEVAVNASLEKSRDVLSYYDAFVLDAETMPELAGLQVIAPLDTFISQEPGLNWFRINRYYRGFSALHEKQTYGVPIGGGGVLMFYRKDLVQQLDISVPSTWDELLATAQNLRGKDLDGDGDPDYPFCISRTGFCAQTVLLSIVTPYIQNAGPSSGFLIDPECGTLLVNSSAFVHALDVWQQLAGLSPEADVGVCTPVFPDLFATGKCLFSVQLVQAFKLYAGPSSAVRDKLGIAPAPGSSLMLNRTTRAMEPCSQALCPLGTAQAKQDMPNATMLVNSAPLMWGGLLGMINARNPRRIQELLIHYFAIASSTQSAENVVSRTSSIGPFRVDHWSAAAQSDWEGAGYSANATEAIRSLLRSQYASSNLAPPLRLQGQYEVRGMLLQAIANLTNGVAPAAVADDLQSSIEAVLMQHYGVLANGTPGYLPLYRRQLGYMEQSDDEPSRPTFHPPSTSTQRVSTQNVVVIAVVLFLVGLIAAVVALEVRNKRRHKDLLGRIKPPLGDPDTTIVVASIQDFDELWEALISDASERALQQFSNLVDQLLRYHSGYRAPSEEEDVVVAFHCPRDACEFAMELQRGLLELSWPRHVLEMEQFRPQYLVQTKRSSFSQSCNGSRPPLSPLGATLPNEDEDKLFAFETCAENVRSFGEQCVASWTSADANTADAELVFCGIRARVGLCAVGFSRLMLEVEPGHKRYTFSGEAVAIAAATAAAAQGGMVLIPQNTFRQLHVEVLAEHCLFCHLGEYQLTADLPPMDLYLALDRRLLGRLALFGPLSCHMQWSQGAFAAPVHCASMVFTHVVGVQTLLAWDFELMQDVIETFTRLAQVELQQAGGYLVEHVEGFMLTAFHSPADAILWGLRMQELMLKEDWPEELLSHELCEEVTVTVPVRGGEVTSATVFRGPRLKTGIDIGQVLARLHTMTGRMTYRGKVMNRAARISAAASSGQVLCSAEAWEACTASASALRLVTATSLGLFQLKGIQERIEVFHCTYQRHMASSTRRSSTVSMGLVSSSDNRRKSALVLSTNSHTISHHTTSYRTSQPSTGLVHMSDVTGRRASAASSALPGMGSTGGGQNSDMLHSVGIDQITTGSGNGAAGVGNSAGGLATGASGSPARYRSALMPMMLGAEVPMAIAAPSSQASLTSRRSNGSGGGNGNSGTTRGARAALAAVLQSRTRSASAIHSAIGSSPFRSNSARSRMPGPGPNTTSAASDPQISLASSNGAAPTPQQPSYARFKATSPAMSPSLALAAAAAAASSERVHHTPKSFMAPDVPRRVVSGPSSRPDRPVDQPSLATLAVQGNFGEGPANVTAAWYAMLPSVVLSNNAASASPVTSGFIMAGGSTAAAPASVRGWDSPGLSHIRNVSCETATVEPQMATIDACVEEIVVEERGSPLATVTSPSNVVNSVAADCAGAIGESPRANGRLHINLRPLLRPLPAGHSQPAASPPHPSSLSTRDSVPPLCQRPSFDVDYDGPRVETLEVTLSANGIARCGLSAGASSTGYGAALGSCMSRSGSATATAGISYLAMTLASGITTGAGHVLPMGAGGSVASSSVSSGAGLPYSQTQILQRPSSSRGSPPQMGTHAASAIAGGRGCRQSGSVNSVDLFLPFPLGANGAKTYASMSSGATTAGVATTVMSAINQQDSRGDSAVSSTGQHMLEGIVDAGTAVGTKGTVAGMGGMPAIGLAKSISGQPPDIWRAASGTSALAGTLSAVAESAVSRLTPVYMKPLSGKGGPRRSGASALSALNPSSLDKAAIATSGNSAATPSSILGLCAASDLASIDRELYVFPVPDSRTNSTTAVMAESGIATTGKVTAARPEVLGGGSGRLRAQRVASHTSANDPPTSHASPSGTWLSGVSARSTVVLQCMPSSSAMASGSMGQPQQATPTAASLRILFSGDENDGGSGSGSGEGGNRDRITGDEEHDAGAAASVGSAHCSGDESTACPDTVASAPVAVR